MRVVVQRVRDASVTVANEMVGSIGHGLLLLVGIAPGDTEADLVAMASKVSGLRIFSDADEKMNHDVAEVGGDVLAVSQFTLFGDVRKGRRPSFGQAADPAVAEVAFERFCELVRANGLRVETGRFGAMMDVAFTNAGPVTLIIESRDGRVL